MNEIISVARGRKFWALKAAGVLFLVTLALIGALSFFEKEIPGSLGIACTTFAAVFPAYIGANAFLKRNEGNEGGVK